MRMFLFQEMAQPRKKKEKCPCIQFTAFLEYLCIALDISKQP